MADTNPPPVGPSLFKTLEGIEDYLTIWNPSTTEDFNREVKGIASWIGTAGGANDFSQLRIRITGLRTQELAALKTTHHLPSKQADINGIFAKFDHLLLQTSAYMLETGNCLRELHLETTSIRKDASIRTMGLLKTKDIPRLTEMTTELSKRASELLTRDREREMIEIANMCARVGKSLARIVEKVLEMLAAVENKASALTDEVQEDSQLDKGKGKST